MPVPKFPACENNIQIYMNKTFKIFILSLCAALFTIPSHAQNGDVKWDIRINGLGGDSFEVVFDAKIETGWHMYDLGPYDEVGPNPTVFVFESTEGLTLDGKPYMLTPPHKEFDDVFEIEIGYFEKNASFAQKVTLTAPAAELKGYVEWMVCNDVGCSPPLEWEFAVPLKGEVKAIPAATAAGTATAAAPVPDMDPAATPASDMVPNTATVSAADPDSLSAQGMEGEEKSLWGLIAEAILWGLAALVTPCVFPMIPMTVSFFLKGSENKSRARFRAGAFGIFIVVLYTLPIAAIILATWIFGGDTVTADIFNWLATHWIPNIIFFLVFMIFAASFFGAFEIALPSKLINRSDKNADRKGLGGVFFMALTLVLVSFSCTGPLVGSVLIRSTSGEFWTPIVTMLAFSVTFAIPFTLFAFFPSLLTRMKSGGWLNSVKVVLGFVELALGLKFLSVADQTYHWGILDREIYLALWIAIFALLGLYLLGKIKFKYDGDIKFVSVPRLAMAIIVFAFVAYLVPGMWGAPLKGLSGYMPPLSTQDFVIEKYSGGAAGGSGFEGKRKYSEIMHPIPHNLDGFFHYGEALEYSKKVDKPLFIDFTGHGCVNCREMEQRVWTDPEVLDLLRNEFVIVALYSDDKKNAYEEDWITTESGRVLKGIGKINSRFATERFGVNAQPAYVIVDNEGRQLVPTRGYGLNIPDYVKFLKAGIEAYRK